MKRKLSFIIIIVLAISTSGYTQTTIPGGDVSGSWDISGSPYLIEGEITVLANDTLTIDPGVEINFQGHHKLIVNGWLLAEGAEEDSILFTAADTSEGWHGIRFVDAPDNSHLSYCIIEQGYAAGSWPDMTGGGILCQNSHPVLTHCTIRNNDAVFGGGVYCYQSVPEIAYCEFTDNTAIRTFSPRGGGLYLNTCDPIVRNCLFSGNVTLWQGGAIVCDYSTAVILNCTIVGNECGTTATSGGGGIYVADSNPTIKNTIVAGNYGRGGIRFVSSPFTSISYCDFFDNQYEDFWDNPIGNLGVMITVN
ncbi:right-handed parallel beta-helix repeat-containing protein, partial [bacterium]|nr:right-handed parallel beta-helix repeat-containing protein [bacterium]